MMQDVLKNLLSNDKINMNDVRKIQDMLKREEILKQYNLPSKPSSDNYFHIQVKDKTKKSGRKQLKAKTLEELCDKIVAFERGNEIGDKDETFERIFEIVEKQKLERVVDPEKLVSRERTVYRDKCEFKRFFSDTNFKDMIISDITKHDIEEVIWKNLKEKKMRVKAFRSLCGILNQVFSYAYNKEIIETNPYSRINHGDFQDGIVSDSKPFEKVYSEKEISDLLKMIHEDEVDRPWQMSIWACEFQILIGGRSAEIPPLKWSDIVDGKIMIYKQQLPNRKKENAPYNNVIVNHTKNYKDRFFPVTNEVRNFLERLKEVHDMYYPENEYLFPHKDTPSGRLSYTMMSNYFTKLCHRNGIEKNVNAKRGLHSFRRNGITKIMNSPGGSAALASEIYGNSPEVAIKNYYTGINLELAKQILEGNKVINS